MKVAATVVEVVRDEAGRSLVVKRRRGNKGSREGEEGKER